MLVFHLDRNHSTFFKLDFFIPKLNWYFISNNEINTLSRYCFGHTPSSFVLIHYIYIQMAKIMYFKKKTKLTQAVVWLVNLWLNWRKQFVFKFCDRSISKPDTKVTWKHVRMTFKKQSKLNTFTYPYRTKMFYNFEAFSDMNRFRYKENLDKRNLDLQNLIQNFQN